MSTMPSVAAEQVSAMALIHRVIKDYKQSRLMRQSVDAENCNVANLQVSVQHANTSYSGDSKCAPEVTIKKVFIENEDAKKASAEMGKSCDESLNATSKSESLDLLELLAKELREDLLQINLHTPLSKESLVVGKQAAKSIKEEGAAKLLMNLNDSLKTSAAIVENLRKINGIESKMRFDENEIAEMMVEYGRRQKEEIRKLVDLNFNDARSSRFRRWRSVLESSRSAARRRRRSWPR